MKPAKQLTVAALALTSARAPDISPVKACEIAKEAYTNMR
jgi:hypothetical protein